MTREEAIEIIKRNCINGSLMHEACEILLPELFESEDERIRKRIRLCLEECVHSDIICDYERSECIAYLERQKEQKPAEWSKEDENVIDETIELIKTFERKYGCPDGFLDIRTKLKSFKPRPHWKPSKEQVEALQNAVALIACHKALAELYNDLMKQK